MNDDYINSGQKPFVVKIPKDMDTNAARKLANRKNKEYYGLGMGFKNHLASACRVCGRHGACSHRIHPKPAIQNCVMADNIKPPTLLAEMFACRICTHTSVVGTHICPGCGCSTPHDGVN